ncbi:transcriptional regulator, AlpA family [Sphingomonas laterariae]|uniref:Transcriptional regulator, AlpA family n=1 Tax=Edaphosphingomonas laterariae TaxID=861865 RepID=A0A239CN88_9SPHN|nr:AlpA family phage regulatory protein [Sphingomonas laterariae]SNS21198.1 transcriptional regulator, AlpA family [Sphingomonas laterariae]
MNIPSNSRLLRITDVMERTALSRSHIYAMVRAEQFPAPKRLGAKCSRWSEGDVDAWIKGRPS